MHSRTPPTEEAQQFYALRAAKIALARLTHDWKPLADIRPPGDDKNLGLAHLVKEGAAVARFVRDEKQGRRIQYKLAGPAPALSPRAQRRKERKQAA